MFCFHFLFKQVAVKRLRLAGFLGLDQRSADYFNFGIAGLIAADQITDILTVIGEFPLCNLRLDPAVLLVGHGDCFACGADGLCSANLFCFIDFFVLENFVDGLCHFFWNCKHCLA